MNWHDGHNFDGVTIKDAEGWMRILKPERYGSRATAEQAVNWFRALAARESLARTSHSSLTASWFAKAAILESKLDEWWPQ